MFRIAKDGEYQPPLAKQQKVHSGADKTSLTWNVSAFLLCLIVDALIFCHSRSATPPPASVTSSPMPPLSATILFLSNSSALLCAQLGHAYSTIPNCRSGVRISSHWRQGSGAHCILLCWWHNDSGQATVEILCVASLGSLQVFEIFW